MKKDKKEYFKESKRLAALYLFDYKNKHKITLRQIEQQEAKERLIYWLDFASFEQRWLKPFVAIPVFVFWFFFD